MPLSSIAGNPLPSIAGSCSGPVIVVGGGRCVWDDLAAVPTVLRCEADFMCVNDIGCHLPHPFQHWFSNDDHQLAYWVGARRRQYWSLSSPKLHTLVDSRNDAAVAWPFPGQGSSARGACFVALGLGYDFVLLCGVPLDDSGHYYDPPLGHPIWNWAGGIRTSRFTNEAKDRHWTDARDQVFDGRVRSMSGRSREILGGLDD